MKILAAYTATADLLQALGSTLAMQSEYFPQAAGIDRVVVTDTTVPKALKVRSLKIDPWVNGQFCLAKCRNVAIDYANKQGYDWIILIDADTILANLPTVFPESGYAPLNLYRTHIGESVATLDFETAPRQDAWFLLGKQLFQHRFDERFLGYGLEEADFIQHVLADVPAGVTDVRAIHIWHERRAALWQIDANQQARSKHLFTKRQVPVLAVLRRREAEERKARNTEAAERIRVAAEANAKAIADRREFEAKVRAEETAVRKTTTKTR